MKKKLTYKVHEIEPYINWLYFFHAWGLTNLQQEEQSNLKSDAIDMLKLLDKKYSTYAIFYISTANSDGDDIIIDNVRIPMLRQQHSDKDGPNLCISDFIAPLGKKDEMGVFATTVDISMEKDFVKDEYKRMLVQTLADRLAEATAEKMHEDVRRTFWGYSPNEHLSIRELHSEKFQGIRPAVGYPSMPDQSINFILDNLICYKDIGIRLTESGAMRPHASVSGLMISHPKAFYFDLGKIGEDQLNDYSKRRGLPIELMRKFLAGNL